MFPPLFHREGALVPGPSEGQFALRGWDASWEILLRETQRLSPVLTSYLPPEVVGCPFANPYGGCPRRFGAELPGRAAGHDVIVLGYCRGEVHHRLTELSPEVMARTVVTYWDSSCRTRAALVGTAPVLAVIPREGLVEWLVEQCRTRPEPSMPVYAAFRRSDEDALVA